MDTKRALLLQVAHFDLWPHSFNMLNCSTIAEYPEDSQFEFDYLQD